MKKVPLYSRSTRRLPPPAEAPAAVSPVAAPADAAPAAAPGFFGRWRQRLARRERWLWFVLALALAGAAGWPAWQQRQAVPLTLKKIDQALRESLTNEPLPSKAARAAEAVRPSVVRVVGHQAPETVARAGAKGPKGKPARPRNAPQAAPQQDNPDEEPDEEGNRSVGTGVVIIDNGTILTNLHVVQGAERIEVTFADGHQSEATVAGVQPENDLAVLRARSIPDDLVAATMRSTGDLAPGDEVVAVGFPFGIGPSVSSGVISGLKRDFRSPEGKRVLSNLIQFDAAANPGNSGGPLVTMDGHVVGVVTAIMNPTEQATFIGIGFAVPIENAAAGAGLPPF